MLASRCQQLQNKLDLLDEHGHQSLAEWHACYGTAASILLDPFYLQSGPGGYVSAAVACIYHVWTFYIWDFCGVCVSSYSCFA